MYRCHIKHDFEWTAGKVYSRVVPLETLSTCWPDPAGETLQN